MRSKKWEGPLNIQCSISNLEYSIWLVIREGGLEPVEVSHNHLICHRDKMWLGKAIGEVGRAAGGSRGQQGAAKDREGGEGVLIESRKGSVLSDDVRVAV